MCPVAVSLPGPLSRECGLITVQSDQPDLFLWRGEVRGMWGVDTPSLALPRLRESVCGCSLLFGSRQEYEKRNIITPP